MLNTYCLALVLLLSSTTCLVIAQSGADRELVTDPTSGLIWVADDRYVVTLGISKTAVMLKKDADRVLEAMTAGLIWTASL